MDLSVYLVTQRYDYSVDKFLNIIKKTCQNGVTMVQLREKKLTTHEFYELGLAVKEITDKYHVPLIINDCVDICLALDAAGVHIGDEELPVSVTRKLIGSNKILGVSAKTVEAGLQAKVAGANYLGVGAMYPTQTKYSSLVSKGTLIDIQKATGLPIVAIGGISSENTPQIMKLPVEGIALVSEIMTATDVSKKVQELKTLVVKGKEENNV